MTPLPELLSRAAGDGPAGFDADDVRSRFERRVRRQRAVVAAAVVLVALALGAAALVAAGAGGDRDGSVADEPGLGPVTVGELTAAPWVIVDTTEAFVVDMSTSLAFSSEGALLEVTASCPVSGRWDLDGDRLRVTGVRSGAPGCETGQEVVEVIAASPTVGRAGDRPGSLELRDGARAMAFERADRLGRVPTEDDLDGVWLADDGTRVVFAADGTVAIGPDSCRIDARWTLDGNRLEITPEEDGGACVQLPLTTEDPYDGASTVRIDGDRLLLATPALAVQLHR